MRWPGASIAPTSRIWAFSQVGLRNSVAKGWSTGKMASGRVSIAWPFLRSGVRPAYPVLIIYLAFVQSPASVARIPPLLSLSIRTVPSTYRPGFRSVLRASPTGIPSRTLSHPAGTSMSFRLVGEPYPWCEILADGCDCHGSEDELSAAYCSDFGLVVEAQQRAGRSPNVRYAENLRKWVERAAERERNSGQQPPYRDAVVRMAESILPAEPDPDRLIIVVVTDRKESQRARNTHHRTEGPDRWTA